MNFDQLHTSLKEAYSHENLNKLSSSIIALYKNKDFGLLRQIHSLIYKGDFGDNERDSKVFSRVISTYHPDRMEQMKKELQRCYTSRNLDELKKMDHILQVQQMDLDLVSTGPGVDVDFSYGDVWDYESEGYSYINDEEQDQSDYDYMDESMIVRDFIYAVKRKIYGYLNVDFPVHLLADMEIIEMAEYEMESLDGVEYCTYARIIDLAGNNLSEVSELRHLGHLQEVYIQNNHISYLDGLNELPYLRVLDASFNEIDDISPLFELDSLEFVNLMGNRIPQWQLEKLSLNGVVVVS